MDLKKQYLNGDSSISGIDNVGQNTVTVTLTLPGYFNFLANQTAIDFDADALIKRAIDVAHKDRESFKESMKWELETYNSKEGTIQFKIGRDEFMGWVNNGFLHDDTGFIRMFDAELMTSTEKNRDHIQRIFDM